MKKGINIYYFCYNSNQNKKNPSFSLEPDLDLMDTELALALISIILVLSFIHSLSILERDRIESFFFIFTFQKMFYHLQWTVHCLNIISGLTNNSRITVEIESFWEVVYFARMFALLFDHGSKVSSI